MLTNHPKNPNMYIPVSKPTGEMPIRIWARAERGYGGLVWNFCANIWGMGQHTASFNPSRWATLVPGRKVAMRLATNPVG